MKKIVTGAISLSCGIALLILSWNILPDAFLLFSRSINIALLPWMIPIVMVSLANTVLASVKWKLCASLLENEQRPLSIYFRTVVVSAFFSMFLSPQLSLVAVRSIGLYQQGMRYTKSIYTVLFDLSHDLLLSVIAVIPAFFVLLRWLTLCEALLFFVALWVLVYCTLHLWHKIIGRFVTSCCRMFVETGHMRWMTRHLHGVMPEVPSSISRRLWIISTMKTGFVLLRFFLVLTATGLSLQFAQTVIAYPFIQFTFLLNLTPGGLGISEWGWAGVLHLQGAEPAIAMTFGMMVRATSYCAIVLIAGAVFMEYLFQHLRKKS